MRTRLMFLISLSAAARLPAQPVQFPLAVPTTYTHSVEGFLQIPVVVNGKQFTCDLDSGGSSVFSLDARKGELAGFKSDGEGASAGAGPRVVRDQRMHGALLQLGPVTIPHKTVVMRPFPAEVAEMDCVLGLFLLREYVVEFDYVTPRVRLLSPQQFHPGPKAIAVPFRMVHDNPVADVTIEFDTGRRVTASMVLDTGAAYYSAVLMASFVEKNQIVTGGLKTATPAHSGDKGPDAVRIQAARAAHIEIGPIRANQAVVALIQNVSVGAEWDGLLGAGFFRRFTATFDYTHGQLYLEPNGRFTEPQSFDASGLAFRRDAGHYVLDLIVPDTPGAGADFREGDLLISINEVEAETLTPNDLTRLLSRPGTDCVLSIRRNGEVRRSTIRLRTRL